MYGLEALGLYNEGRLTAWGKLFIKEEGTLPTPRPPEPCYLDEDHFIAPLAQHMDLLWEIEKHLRPSSPGKYPLTQRAIRFLQGDPHDLILLLERGLQGSLPDEIKARTLGSAIPARERRHRAGIFASSRPPKLAAPTQSSSAHRAVSFSAPHPDLDPKRTCLTQNPKTARRSYRKP